MTAVSATAVAATVIEIAAVMTRVPATVLIMLRCVVPDIPDGLQRPVFVGFDGFAVLDLDHSTEAPPRFGPYPTRCLRCVLLQYNPFGPARRSEAYSPSQG